MTYHKILFCLIIFLFSLNSVSSQNVNQSKSAKMGNRHVKSSDKGGKPDNAVGFVSEGNLAFFSNKDSLFLEDLDPDLEAMGVTKEDWSGVQNKLRDRWTLLDNADFKKAIDELNQDLFFKHDCIAVYAEYGGKGGQKAMTIYTKEVWKSLPE